MAQLGDFARAKALLRRAARGFGTSEPVARARCVVAEAELALVSRDLKVPETALDEARSTLQAHGDRANALHASQLEARRLLLIGRVDEAERRLGRLRPAEVSPAFEAIHELIKAGIAIRRLRSKTAEGALARASAAAARARIPALAAEIELASQNLRSPVARSTVSGVERGVLRLDDVEALFASRAMVVDACRHSVRRSNVVISLTTRPVLFALARALGESWPNEVCRANLIARAFRIKRIDETHRARLRVEIGRLRKLLHDIATLNATSRGYVLAPRAAGEIVVLASLVDASHAVVLAMLSDGESWSSSALAIALGISQRKVQRELSALARGGKIQSYGHGRARRWMTTPVPGFTTTLLLPAPLSNG